MTFLLYHSFARVGYVILYMFYILLYNRRIICKQLEKIVQFKGIEIKVIISHFMMICDKVSLEQLYFNFSSVPTL